MGVLTMRNVAVIKAPHSKGVLYAVSGTNKKAQAALDTCLPYYAKKTPGGYYLLSEKHLRLLCTQIKMGIAA